MTEKLSARPDLKHGSRSEFSVYSLAELPSVEIVYSSANSDATWRDLSPSWSSQ